MSRARFSLVSIAYVELTALLWLVRLSPLWALLVWLSRGMFSGLVAASMVLALAVFFVPVGAATLSGSTVVPLVALGMSLLRELCLGALVALAIGLPLWAAYAAARFSEQTSALGYAQAAGPIGLLYGLCAAALSLSLGVHRTLILALHGSLLSAPVQGPNFSGQAWVWGVVQLVGESFGLALALGIPLLFSVWLLEIACAIWLRVGRAHGPLALGLKGPVFLLLALLLLAPLVAEVPAALRVFQRLLREVTQSVVR